MTRSSDAGFTLIEALVAMAVLAVGAISLLGATEGHSARIGQVIDRTSARWAAEARLAELRLGLVPDTDRVESYGRIWVVSTESAQTEDPALARITITVASEESDSILVALVGYIQTPEEA